MGDRESVQGSRRAGVRDVAALAGVSPQTVSRVINDHPSVRDETRERVRDAMQRLGYRVNNAARSLGTRRTRTLGVIASNAALFGPSAGVAAIETAARAAERWVTTAYADAADESSTAASLEHLLAQGVDGVVVVAPRVGTVPALRARSAVDVVPYPSEDGARGQTLASAIVVKHLVDLGHRRIARLGGPADWFEERARAEGFDEAMACAASENAGASVAGRWSGDWSAASGASVAVEIAASVRESGATAIVVANDQMALGLIAGLADEGIAVPGDVSVVGFDDNTDAAYYRPALTTVRLDVEGEARRCVREALGVEIAGDDGAGRPVRAPELIVRDSTAEV